MAISYPIAFPTVIAPRHFELFYTRAGALATSPFTLQHQAQVHPGQRWRVRAQWPRVNRDKAEELFAFLLKLDGVKGTFLLGDEAARTPRGAAAATPGTPKVAGAGQTGESLNGDGGGTSGELLGNPGFETADLTNWNVESAGGPTGWQVNNAADVVHSGSWGLFYDPAGQTSDASLRGLMTGDAVVPASAGDQVYQEAWIKGLDVGPWNDVDLQINFRDDTAGLSNVSSGTVTPSASWQKITAAGTAPAGTTRIFPRLRVFNGGNADKIAWDDASFVRGIQGWLKAGDYVQLGSGASARLYKLMEDADTDGQGAFTLSFRPDLRSSPADDSDIVVQDAKGVFRLTGGTASRRAETVLFGAHGFEAVEVI